MRFIRINRFVLFSHFIDSLTPIVGSITSFLYSRFSEERVEAVFTICMIIVFSIYWYVQIQKDREALWVSIQAIYYLCITWVWPFVNSYFIYIMNLPVIAIIKFVLLVADSLYTTIMATLEDPIIILIYYKIYLVFNNCNEFVKSYFIFLKAYFARLKNHVSMAWLWNLVQPDITPGQCPTGVNMDRQDKTSS
jgi:hypothetical protein